MTTKGEAIALGIAQMSVVELGTCDHGVVAKVKRCIMQRDLYPRSWGKGPVAVEKKKLKSEGKLDKHGRANENTPAQWKSEYKDFGPPPGEEYVGPGSAEQPVADAPKNEDFPAAKTVNGELKEEKEEKKDKKKRKYEDETPEEKAARKKAKAEKKARKESKQADGAAQESD